MPWYQWLFISLCFEKSINTPTQAGCKVFNKKLNNFKSKVILHNPYLKNTTISVPRIAPPLSRLVPTIRHIEAQLGIQHNSDGTIAYASFQDVVKLMMMQDPGTHDMPTSSSFLGGPLKLPIIIKYDATGFGTLQLTTLALHNPYMRRKPLNNFASWAWGRSATIGAE